MIVIELAGEPRGKGRPRFVRRTGVAYTDGATRSYEGALRLAAQERMCGRRMLEGPLRVVIEAHMPIPPSWPKSRRSAAELGVVRPTVRPDLDNFMKMLDALNEIVFQDDKQIVAAELSKRYSATPKLRIEISAVNGGG